VASNLNALTPRRLLALFAFFGFLFIGVQLAAIDLPFEYGFAAFVFLSLTAAHTYQREGPLEGADMMVAAWDVLAAVMVLVDLDVLAIPFGDGWVALSIVALLWAHGFVVTQKG